MENEPIAALNLPTRARNCLRNFGGTEMTVGDLVRELETNGWKKLVRIDQFGRVTANHVVKGLEAAGFHAKNGWHGATWSWGRPLGDAPRENGTSVYLLESQIEELLSQSQADWFSEKLNAALPKVR